MQKYFVENIKSEKITFFEDDIHHIKNVMKMQKGDKVICIFNNKKFVCVIDELSPLIVRKESEINENTELRNNITILLSLFKKTRLEVAIEKAVELGVSKIVLWKSSRSNFDIQNIDKYVSRLKKIAKEAAEQSNRNIIPEIIFEKKNSDIFSKYKSRINFIAYEKSSNKLDVKNSSNYNVTIAIGPEGGFSSEEVDSFGNNDFLEFTMGRRILRAETAVLFALSLFVYSNEVF